MKKLFILFAGLLLMSCQPVKKADTSIHLSSVGFLPSTPKKASIIGQAGSFVIKQTTGDTVVFEGKLSGPFSQEELDQEVMMADFSGCEFLNL